MGVPLFIMFLIEVFTMRLSLQHIQKFVPLMSPNFLGETNYSFLSSLLLGKVPLVVEGGHHPVSVISSKVRHGRVYPSIGGGMSVEPLTESEIKAWELCVRISLLRKLFGLPCVTFMSLSDIRGVSSEDRQDLAKMALSDPCSMLPVEFETVITEVVRDLGLPAQFIWEFKNELKVILQSSVSNSIRAALMK